jgi:hypothetical protein
MFAQRPDAKNQEPPTLEEMQTALEKNGLSRLKLHDPEWLAYFAVNERYSSQIRVGRVFLCGDAAHIHSPAGGQGMNTGMQDAFNLGWKLGLLTRGKGSEEALADSVQEERHPVAQALVEKTTMLLHAAMANNVFVRLAKDVAVTFLFQSHFVQKKLSGELSELHIAYHSSPLIVPDQTWPNHGGFEPGSKPRDAHLIHAETKTPTSLWRQYLGTRHTLVLFSGKHPTDQTMQSLIDLADTLTSTHGDELQVLVVYTDAPAPCSPQVSTIYLDPGGKAHDRYGLEHAGWYLVRPDQYLAARSASLQTASLYSYLEKAMT